VTALTVRGGATPEEIAAVLAVILPGEDHATPDSAPRDPYRNWRDIRLAALRRTVA
jgi:hypothetical protein